MLGDDRDAQRPGAPALADSRGILQESNDFKESKVSKARPLRFRGRGATRVPWSAQGFAALRNQKNQSKIRLLRW